MKHTTYLAQRTDTRQLPGSARITATSHLVHLEGNARPHFSCTGIVDDAATRRRGDCLSAGCIHDEIAHHFPKLRPVILVHLADDRGVPMHAASNAVYWSGFSVMSAARPATRKPCYACGVDKYVPARPVELMVPGPVHGHDYETDAAGVKWLPTMLAQHLRVPLDVARDIRAYIAGDNHPSAAAEFCLHDLKAQWQTEADAALAVIREGENK